MACAIGLSRILREDRATKDGYVLIGLRRAGKSYTLFEHIQRLIKTGEAKPQDILYVNF